MSIYIDSHIVLAILFFMVSFSYVFFLSRGSMRRFFMDKPDLRKMHAIHVPRIGGVGVIAAYLSVVALVYFLGKGTASYETLFLTDIGKAINFSAIGIFLLGFFDDSVFVELNVPIKFGAQLAISILVVYLFGIAIEEVNLFGFSLHLGEVGKILTVFWIVGVTNAFNIIDGIDGLAASVTIISLFIASIVFLAAGSSDAINMLYITIPLISVIAGFLAHNYPPASLFAGDTGSLFFGVTAAIISVKIAESTGGDGKSIDTLTAFWVVSFPVIEVGVSMIRRYYYAWEKDKGVKDSIKQVVTPDNLHMHHRLIFKGFSHEQALRFLTFLSFAVSSAAIVFALTENRIIKLVSLVYSFYVLIMVLHRLGYGQNRIFGRNESSNTVRKYLSITGDNEYFEHAIRFYAGKQYNITRFELVADLNSFETLGTIILYNEEPSQISKKIEMVEEIRKNFQEPIVLITTAKIDEAFLQKQTNLFVVRKPVDMPYLLHDIETVSSGTGSVSKDVREGTIAIDKEVVA